MNQTVLSQQEIEKALAQAKAVLAPEPVRILENTVHAYLNLLRILEDKKITIKRLRRMLFGPTSEKAEQLIAQALALAKGEALPGGAKTLQAKVKRPPAGHGRNGEADYRGG